MEAPRRYVRIFAVHALYTKPLRDDRIVSKSNSMIRLNGEEWLFTYDCRILRMLIVKCY